jgi:protein TonB
MNFSHEKEPGKNLTGITIVVLLHVLVAWGIINGLGTKVISKVQEAVETKLIEEVKPPPPPETPPPPPPPEMKAPPPPFIPPVEVQVQQPPTTSLTPPAPPAQPATAAAPAGPSRTPAVADFSTCAKPEYPKASARNEEEGTTTISFLIGVDGRMVDSKITKSSGSRDLDRAAQQAIGKCRFKPAMNNGQPEQAWVPVQYVWSLEQ